MCGTRSQFDPRLLYNTVEHAVSHGGRGGERAEPSPAREPTHDPHLERCGLVHSASLALAQRVMQFTCGAANEGLKRAPIQRRIVS